MWPDIHSMTVTTMNPKIQTWCAIAGQENPLLVDFTGCSYVYDAKKAIVDASQLKIPLVRTELWKVSWQNAVVIYLFISPSKIKEPSLWPIDSVDYFLEVPTDDEDLKDIASLLYSHESSAVMLGSSNNENNLAFIMRVKGKVGTKLRSISVPVKLMSVQKPDAGSDFIVPLAAVYLVCIRRNASYISSRHRKS